MRKLRQSNQFENHVVIFVSFLFEPGQFTMELLEVIWEK